MWQGRKAAKKHPLLLGKTDGNLLLYKHRTEIRIIHNCILKARLDFPEKPEFPGENPRASGRKENRPRHKK